MVSRAHRIVLVEDSPTQAAKLSAQLEAEGFEVKACSSAEEGLREISDNPPDLLVVDYYLPGLRGDELCRRIRMNIEARQIPVLMFTVDDTHAMELRGLDSGADDYISKSADPEVLIARIRALLRKGRESQAILGAAQPHMRDVWMLAVDDSPTYLEKIVLELEQDGYKCDRAASGGECLKKLEARPFDCVILDLVMPGMDGIAVCRRITEMRRGLRNPLAVLMLTAQEGKEDLTRALEAGADDFVGKSSEMAVLKGRIRALLRRNFYLEENRKIIEELKAKEMEAVRAKIEKEAAQARASLAQKLEIANAKLEEANRELESFSYSVSHDLRSPLRTIDGFSQVLLEDYADKLDEPGKDHLNRVRRGCQQMGELIDDLLNLARVIRHEIKMEKTDLIVIARAVMEQLKKANPGRKPEFTAPPKLPVTGDPGLLRAAIENLLGNAWKFTGKKMGAKIELGTMRKDGETIYFVRDNGAGFDMSYANKLFAAFQRLHSQEEFPGTGIGLATVQRIVRRHGGRIWAEGAVDKGAAFYFTLGGLDGSQ
ncbi:MAG: response regulator [Elusimicrobia bacterium]|nr:response regulator [Elusimicrobiota bacterium]